MKTVNRHHGTLLVVDDIAANRDLLSRYFGARGFEIAEADCGLTALSMIKEQQFDAVLLDIIMPEIDGIEVLKRIRASHTQADLPVFMVSGQSARHDIRLSLDLGANDYFTKPIDLAAALTKLKHALGLLPDKQTKPQVPETARAEDVNKANPRAPDAGTLQGAATRFRKQSDPAYAEQLTGKDAQNPRELRRKARRQLQCTAWLLLDKQIPPTRCTIADLSSLGTCVVLQSEQDLPNDFILLLTGSAWFNCCLVWRTGLKVGIEFTSGLIESGKERPQIGASINSLL
jgi:Response regulator containing CheY-like receiver, AAA-type ATPase, and DNA-binding domains